MTVDPVTLKVTLLPNESEVNKQWTRWSADSKGMTLKPGKPVSTLSLWLVWSRQP